MRKLKEGNLACDVNLGVTEVIHRMVIDHTYRLQEGNTTQIS